MKKQVGTTSIYDHFALFKYRVWLINCFYTRHGTNIYVMGRVRNSVVRLICIYIPGKYKSFSAYRKLRFKKLKLVK